MCQNGFGSGKAKKCPDREHLSRLQFGFIRVVTMISADLSTSVAMLTFPRTSDALFCLLLKSCTGGLIGTFVGRPMIQFVSLEIRRATGVSKNI